MSRIVVPYALVIATVYFSPAIARACSCGSILELSVLPKPGATGVPTNARIWLSTTLTADPADVAIMGPMGEVGFTSSSVHVTYRQDPPLLLVLTPDGLAAGESYDVMVGGQQVSSFTVGGTADTTRPPVPTILGYEQTSTPGDADVDCGEPTYLMTFRLMYEANNLVLMDRDNTSTFSADSLSGAVTEVSSQKFISVGRGDCVFNWPEATAKARSNVRFASVDLSGNVSEWTAPSNVVIPPHEDEESCRVSDESPQSWWLVAPLWAAFRRRTRHQG